MMYYHLIMVVRYRRKVIDNPISERAKGIWEHIASGYGIILEEWNHDIDHVYVMFHAQSRTELSKFINAWKSASSRLLKKEYLEIREKLWKEAFWSQSFCPADSRRGSGRSNPSRHWNPGREKVLNIAYRFRIYPTEEQKILLVIHQDIETQGGKKYWT